MEEDRVYGSMLFDYYGELLTEKQREYYDLHFNEDFSLYEIAEQSGVSRQTVWDIIRRADRTLRETEQKTGLVARALRRREAGEKALRVLETLPDSPEKQQLRQLISELSGE